MSRSRACAAVVALAFVFPIGISPHAHALCGIRDCVSDDLVAREPRPWDRHPFRTEERRALVGRPLPDPVPTARMPPIVDLLGVSYYVDASHSVVDPALKRRNEAAFRRLHSYVSRVVSLADGWARSRPAKPAYAVRLVNLLAGWAEEDALLGAVNQQGAYERVWTLSALSLAYLRVRDAPELDRAQQAEVELWLGRVARAVRDHFKDEGPVSRVNNHACWAAVAVVAAATAARDKDLFGWGVSTAETALGQVRGDGFLPLELQRKALALHYHLFALAPLVMFSKLAAANGVRLTDEADMELGWLIDRVTTGLQIRLHLPRRPAHRGRSRFPHVAQTSRGRRSCTPIRTIAAWRRCSPPRGRCATIG